MRRQGLEDADQTLGVVREFLVHENRILRLAVVAAQVDEHDVGTAGEGFAQPAFRPVGEIAVTEHRAGTHAVIFDMPGVSEQGLRLGGIGLGGRAGRAGALGNAGAHEGHPHLGGKGQGGGPGKQCQGQSFPRRVI